MNKADELFEMLQAAYLRGANWLKENGSDEGLKKAAYDYADYHTSPLTIAERKAFSVSPAGVVKPLEWNGWENEEKLTVEEAWQILVETPDITSPEEYPDHALITMEQLGSFMARARIMSAIEPAGVGVETAPPQTHLLVDTGCKDKDGNALYLGDRIRYRLEGSHTKREYWNPEYEIIWDAPSFTLKHVGGGKDGGSHAFILKHGGFNGDLTLISRGPHHPAPQTRASVPAALKGDEQ